jgi:S-disulfanyl-L-cysteine oxidoreductase SoxD
MSGDPHDSRRVRYLNAATPAYLINRRFAVLTWILLTCTGSITWWAKAEAQPISGSFAHEVYTSAQANRGEQAYNTYCSSCHKADLTGTERVPPLAGDSFERIWQASTLRDLFERVASTMPQLAPHSLSDATYVDIVAFLLQANGYQPGGSELAADPTILGQLRIRDVK